MSFSGFSDADIEKLKIPLSKNGPTIRHPTKEGKIVKLNNNNNTTKRKPINLPSKNEQNSTELRKISEEEKLAPQVKSYPEKPTQMKITTQKVEERKTMENNNAEEVDKQAAELAPPQLTSIEDSTNILDFEIKQKIMEEQNRKRKELLVKALAAKTQQTLEETQKLNLIKAEFKTLDAMLSNDVKILRKRIENADLEYTECKKKYDRIEKEFLEAKIQLHKKLEKKEMLTQHLHTIIDTNEERKAEKLTELLHKLQIDVQE